MILNKYQLNTKQANWVDLALFHDAASVADIEQIVGVIFLGQLLRLSQTVNFYETASGQMVSFEQSVQATASGQMVAIEQFIL